MCVCWGGGGYELWVCMYMLRDNQSFLSSISPLITVQCFETRTQEFVYLLHIYGAHVCWSYMYCTKNQVCASLNELHVQPLN